MNRYNEVDGDLISLARKGMFDVISHGCNCFSTMGAGIAPQMAKAFGCDKFEMETWGRTIEKLGCIDYKTFVLGKFVMWSLSDANNKDGDKELTVVNSYTQFSTWSGKDKPALDYEALTLCMRKINYAFKGKHIGLPKIGAGLAGGNWERIKEIIQTELIDCEITVVNFKSDEIPTL